MSFPSEQLADLPQWQHPESMVEECNINGYKIWIAGFWRHAKGTIVSGSAADTSKELAESRAAFEYLERLAIIEAQVKKPQELLPNDFDTKGRNFKWSRSNGIAIARTESEARRAATLELFERDMVLKSWAGLITPTLETPIDVPKAIETIYDIFSLSLTYKDCNFVTVAYIGFPKSDEETRPVIQGYGCSDSVKEAHKKAKDEMLQKLAFLWGEEISQTFPLQEPTPMFHQEYYSNSKRAAPLRKWVERSKDQYRSVSAPGRLSAMTITPMQFTNLSVAQVHAEDCWPLLFGEYPWPKSCVGKVIDPLHPIT